MTIAPGNLAQAQDVDGQLAARLLRAANLADVPNKALALANLGARSMALQDAAAVVITGGSLDGVAIGGQDPAYGSFAQLDMVGDFTALATGEFWSNDGARVMRINDRLLVGGAAANDAAKPNTEKDWLSVLVGWPVYNATAAITSAFGTIGLTVGSQTADLDPIAASSTETSIGIAAFGIANNAGTFPSGYFAAYGYYGEGRVYPGTVSNAFAAELNAVNISGNPNITPTPYRELATGSAQALRLASGGGQGLSPDPAISAIAIVQNEATFNVGIVFGRDSLTGADGTDGFATAIAMARGHLLTWFTADGGDGAATMTITSAISDPTRYVSMQAQDAGWLFIQPSGNVGFEVATVDAAVNGVAAVPSATNEAAGIEARGIGANGNLALRARGGGHFELRCTTLDAATAGSGGALPATVEAYLQVSVDDGETIADYAIPMFLNS